MLNARQLGLKFIANVTYGYTSATFSGRMPCVEIADAIVQTGRETLENVSDRMPFKRFFGSDYSVCRLRRQYAKTRTGTLEWSTETRTAFSSTCLGGQKKTLSGSVTRLPKQ
jgi:predicted TIM-barrel fold metal-dependent hydrolase